MLSGLNIREDLLNSIMLMCNLTNIETGESIRCKSVTSFCKKAGLFKIDRNAKVHVYPIIKGLRFSYFGWCLTSMYRKHVKLKDMYGNVYSGRLGLIIDSFNVPYCRVFKLITGRKKIINGLSLYETEINHIPPKNKKVIKYTLNTPNGKSLSGKTIVSLERQIGRHNLTRESIHRLIHGHSFNVKDYTVEEIKTEHRYSLTKRI